MRWQSLVLIAWLLGCGPFVRAQELGRSDNQVQADSQWVSLFNGKDLTNWKTHPDQPGGWRVENGLLVGRTTREPGQTMARHLFSERADFEDFQIRAEVKINRGGNSGLYFRSNFDVSRSGRYPTGYEAQIYHGQENQPVPPSGYTGGLAYFANAAKSPVKPDEWFTLEVIAKDNRLTIKVDGEVTTDLVDEKTTHRNGHVGLQVMSDGNDFGADTIVQYRKIEIKESKQVSVAGKAAVHEATAQPPTSRERTGSVVVAEGRSVQIKLGSTAGVVAGDKVEIFVVIPGLDEQALVASGKVSEVRPDGVTAVIETSTGEVAAGQQARIITTPPVVTTLRPSVDRSKPAFLGVRSDSATAKQAARAGLPEALGVLVLTKLPGSPAENLQANDIILKIDNELTPNMEALSKALNARRAGDRATLMIARGTKHYKLDVRLGEDPGNAGYMKLAKQGAEAGDAVLMATLGDCYYNGNKVAQDKSEAMRWYRRAADKGYAPSQATLGYLYEHGDGVPQDSKQAAVWYRAAAEQGDAESQGRLGSLYDKGTGVTKNLTEAYKWYLKAAEQGLAWSQFNAGVCLAKGQGTNQDEQAAVKWFQLAANEKMPEAQNYLGRMYEQGRGVTKDEAAAARWYRLAADQGDMWGLVNLGILYNTGRGVPQNSAQAAVLFQQAAEKGHLDSQSTLGNWYQIGHGVPKDYAQSVKWSRQAADRGDALAQIGLGVAYENGWGVAQNKQTAFQWYRKAGEQKHASGQLNVGICYAEGVGVSRDYRVAAQWIRKSADQGLPEAQNWLGTMYQKGLGVTKNEAQAVEWYHKAAKQGLAVAQHNLGFLIERGMGVKQDYGVAMQWYRKAAAQGNADAEAYIGVLYENGWGVAQDRTEAIAHYLKASDQGSEFAKECLRNLGIKP